MNIIQAKNYNNRKKLDKFCKSIKNKEDYEIQGTKEELEKIHLKDGLFVHEIISKQLN